MDERGSIVFINKKPEPQPSIVCLPSGAVSKGGDFMPSRYDNRRRLTRSAHNRRVCGVLGGFADYFGLNATYMRIAYVAFTLLVWTVPGVIIYFMMALAMPPEKPVRPAFFDRQDAEHRQRRELHNVEEEDEKKG